MPIENIKLFWDWLTQDPIESMLGPAFDHLTITEQKEAADVLRGCMDAQGLYVMSLKRKISGTNVTFTVFLGVINSPNHEVVIEVPIEI